MLLKGRWRGTLIALESRCAYSETGLYAYHIPVSLTRYDKDTDERGKAMAERAEIVKKSQEGLDAGKQKGKPFVKKTEKHNNELGKRGEDAAARFLCRRGYDIVERNWVCLAGEADIIARDGDAVVFVEVKTRSNCEKGFPSEAVDTGKRERYERIAALFLKNFDVVDVPVRFDVISIVLIASDRALIRHHINAFSA